MTGISSKLRGIVWACLFIVVSDPVAHADYEEEGLASMMLEADFIILAKMTPAGEKLEVKIEEVLKGALPPGFTLKIWESHPYKTPEGREERSYWLDDQISVNTEDLALSPQQFVFLRTRHENDIRPCHPYGVKPASVKSRLLELLSMMRNPAPFVSSQRYQEDKDLIYIIGCLFYALTISAPDLSFIPKTVAPDSWAHRSMPWERLCVKLTFTFVPTRQPALRMEPFEAKGVSPRLIDFFRRGIEPELNSEDAKGKLPAAFTVTVDTTLKPRVGDLTSKAAVDFLRARLQSAKPEVVQAAFLALGKMLDRDSVPLAIDLLRMLHKDRRSRAAAAHFLDWARDPRSIEPICTTLSELPPYICYGSHGYDSALQELGSALGEAVCNLNDARTIPTLKRAILKGYAGFRISWTLSQIGSEDAFEILLKNVCSLPAENSLYPALDLLNMVRRSNLPIEPWMKGPSSNRASYSGFVAQWVEWWKQHKAEFRIVRSSEEARKLYGD